MVFALWLAASLLFLDLLLIYRDASQRKWTQVTPAIAVVCTLTRGFYITVLVLAATKGVTP